MQKPPKVPTVPEVDDESMSEDSLLLRRRAMQSHLDVSRSDSKKRHHRRTVNADGTRPHDTGWTFLSTPIDSLSSFLDRREEDDPIIYNRPYRPVSVIPSLSTPIDSLPSFLGRREEDDPIIYNPPYRPMSVIPSLSADTLDPIFWEGPAKNVRPGSEILRSLHLYEANVPYSSQDIVSHQSLGEGESSIEAGPGKSAGLIGWARWGPHVLLNWKFTLLSTGDGKHVQSMLPEAWKWDVGYHVLHSKLLRGFGSWTCTPLEPHETSMYPLTIAGAPVVLSVEYRWPLCDGVSPPPDPHPATPIDCIAGISSEVVRDLFFTFQGSPGFYILINGLLQIIVPDDFDTTWASSHLPHKYGGLKVCYIKRTLQPTMLPGTTETSSEGPCLEVLGTSSRMSALPSLTRPAPQPLAIKQFLKINDFIEARPLPNHRREKYAGRIGLKVVKEGSPFVIMSTHIITEAILAKSRWEALFSLWGDARFLKLKNDWNDYTVIRAGDRTIGRIDKTFDREAGVYPDGFSHDITLIKPTSPSIVEDIISPVPNLGWLNHESWTSLRQQTSKVKILADNESTQSAKSIKCSRPLEILVVGEGIFLNQKAAAGGSKSLKEHDASTWKDLVSCAVLYRVHPDFDPPNGHSGTALYADGVREDGTQGPGIVGFQSFVQRSGHVQNFEMEGPALEQRLQLGRVAFYGAFEVPAELKQYDIV